MPKLNSVDGRDYNGRDIYRKFTEIFERQRGVNRIVRLGDQHVRPATCSPHQSLDGRLDLVRTAVAPHRNDKAVIRQLFGFGVERPADEKLSLIHI